MDCEIGWPHSSEFDSVLCVEIKCLLDATEVFIAEPLLHLIGILFPRINDDAWSKPHQISIVYL